MPAYFFYILRKNKDLIENIDNAAERDLSDKNKIEIFVRRWGFIILGMKPEFYFWEIVVMLRKTIMIFATDSLSSISSDV